MLDYIVRYEIAACIIAFAIRLSYFKQKGIRTTTSIAFDCLAWQCLVSSFLSIISVYLMKHSFTGFIWLNYLVNIVYYVFFNAMPLCFYLCLWYLTENNREMPKKQYWWYFGIYLFYSVFTLTTPLTHFVFWFDENAGLHHNFLFYGYYVLDLFYIISGVVHFFRHRKQFTSNQTITILFYTTACFIAALVQTFHPRILITGFVFSITIFITYLSLENPDEYIDDETGLYSRLAFKIKARSNLDLKRGMYIIGINALSFSHILRSLGEANKEAFYKEIFSSLRKISGTKFIFKLTDHKAAIILPQDEEIDGDEVVKFIRNYFKDPIKCENLEIPVSVIIKTVQTPQDVSSLEDLIDLLEDSLDDKVNSDPASSFHANKAILENKKRENKIIQLLEDAMDENTFDIVFQPIYNIKKAGYTSAEALIRLRSEELGYINPEEFIPLAEKNGLVMNIGNFVLNRTCKLISENRLWEKGIEQVHINLSVIQCMQERMYEHIFEILDYYNLDYRYINLNVTETTTIAANEILLRNMNVMKDFKLYFSLDNYGTGLSNTNTLVKYPFKTVKLDRSLIHAAVEDAKARIILRKTVSMIKDLDMQVVAVGVEDMGQYDMVVYLDCDYIQGNMFSTPLEPEQFLKFIAKHAEKDQTL